MFKHRGLASSGSGPQAEGECPSLKDSSGIQKERYFYARATCLLVRKVFKLGYVLQALLLCVSRDSRCVVLHTLSTGRLIGSPLPACTSILLCLIVIHPSTSLGRFDVPWVFISAITNSLMKLRLLFSTKSQLCRIMLKPAAHQVAGHQAGVGTVGPLVDGAGKFYKPLQDGERGLREKKFYEQFWADNDVPASVKAFFPGFYGTTEIEALDGSGFIEHMVLEDLTHRFRQPCVMDLKMGVHTWYPGASDQYIAKCMEKDAETTSKELGFRVSGLQVFDASNGKTWKPGRVWCKMLDVDATKALMKQFVSSNPTDDKSPDLAYASGVYDCAGGIIDQLRELRCWFAVQKNYHFFSSSILLMYESDCAPLGSQANMCGSVKLVDFAHVLIGQGAVDENFLQGLNSLIGILCEIAGHM